MSTLELEESMKPILLCLSLLTVSTPALSQPLPPGVDLADPSTLTSPRSCVAECGGVYSGCREQCGETKARADQEHFDLPDMPVDECLHACEVDLAACKDTCRN